MEETHSKVLLEANEISHRDITPSQCISKEIKNVALASEEFTENPEYVVMRRSVDVQSVTIEEVVIPKLVPAANLLPNFSVNCPEAIANTIEMDISSQESAMDIASQESLTFKNSKSEETLYCNPKVSVSLREAAVLMSEEDIQKREEDVKKREEDVQKREEDVQKREENVQKREENVQKREEIVLNSEKKLKTREENVAKQENIMIQMEKAIHTQQEWINYQTKVISNQELTLKDREAAVRSQEFEAVEYKNILHSTKSNGNGCLPSKRAKKS